MCVACLLVLLVLCLHPIYSARILGVFAHPARSNSLFCHSVMSAMGAGGHDVTVYSANKPSLGVNFTHVHVYTDWHKEIDDGLDYKTFISKFSKTTSFGGKVLRIIANIKSESFLKHPKVQELLHSDKKYDLVVTEGTFGEESLLVFGHKFGAPTIILIPSGTWSIVDYMAGNSLSLAYSPDYYACPYTDHMSFFERLHSVSSSLASILIYHWYDLPCHDSILLQHAAHLRPPPVADMVKDVAITFSNVHPTIGYMKPLSPNIIPVGGVHINPKTNQLPKEIQRLMDSATEGVIYFSLGTIVPVDSMPAHVLEAFIRVFKKLPQKIIWKVSGGIAKNISDNVITASWLPQQSILSHPNCVLFLTHGGLGSQLEAFYSGVPVVGLPFFSDQPYNIRMYQHLGVGVGITIDTLSENTVYSAIQTVLTNKSYAYNARRIQQMYFDRPQEPAALILYWTEYVLKHRGQHLRPQAVLMPLYQRALIDIIVLTTIALCVLAVLSKIAFTILINRIFSNNVKNKEKNY